MKSYPIYTVDSFTNKAFKGNPAGVCLVDEPIDDGSMLAIAQELNLSETAFVTQVNDHYSIRYFSPIQEIPLCGHATLAAAKILFEEKSLNEIHFITNSRVDLRIKRSEEQIEMAFPRYSTIQSSASDKLLKALGINQLNDVRYNKENNILMLVIGEDVLESLSPDYNALIMSHDSINGVLVTSGSSGKYDFKSRYFWPWSGGNEDPVTGAIQTFMAPYWAAKLNKNHLTSFQASKRTGFMEVVVETEKIVIRGNAVIVIKGILTV